MKKLFKAGILLITLAVPVFIFLFLKAFGSNNFTIPIYYEEGVISSLSQCTFSKDVHRIPDFELTTSRNTKISHQVLEGKVTVVDFFFTSCPNICPAMSKEMSRVHDKYKSHPDFQILSFTVDPQHDNVSSLDKYSKRFEIRGNEWQFITGEKEKIYHLARCGFILPVEDGDGSPEDFIHSEKFILVDAQKRIRGYYDGTDREDVDRLITEIDILNKEQL
ncbi:MAG: SCO family protein [Bacteroidota bacterium]|nr:SCO family protein [Bacteroidota bacterium]